MPRGSVNPTNMQPDLNISGQKKTIPISIKTNKIFGSRKMTHQINMNARMADG